MKVDSKKVKKYIEEDKNRTCICNSTTVNNTNDNCLASFIIHIYNYGFLS